MIRVFLSVVMLSIVTGAGILTSPTTPTVNAGPDITILVNEPASLQGTASGFFDGLQADGRASVRWTFGYGGWNYEGSAIAPVAYPEAGTYTATLTACDAAGACASDSATITVNAIPEGTETVLADSGNPVTNMATLQAAVDSKTGVSNPVITLPLGFVARGTLFLRHRTVVNYMTIRTAGYASLPNGTTRVSPSDASNMVVLEQSVSDMIINTPAPSSTPPRYYRFLGIRLRKSSPSLNYTHTFAQIGDNGATSLSQLPNHILFDRCFFDGGDTTSNTLRGVLFRANDSAVVNSYFYRFKGVGIEVQAILTVSGERQNIMNNYLQASTENYLSGGTSPEIVGHNPTDVVFRRNYLEKDPCWRPADPCYYGTNMVIKNLYELKLANRYSTQGNIFRTHWEEDQPGYGIVVTPRNDEGNAPWSQISYVDFAYNKIIQSARGLNVLGADDLHPSQTTNHVIIRHNTFAGINWAGGISNTFIFPGGVTGPDRLFVVNNSTDQNGDPEFGHGRLINFETGTTMRNFVFSGNIGQGFFNHEGGTGTTAFQLATGGSYSATKNGLYRSQGTNPTGNTTVATLADVKYTDVATFNLLLRDDSPFLTTGFNGLRSGADIATLNSLTSGVVTGNWGAPVSTVSVTGSVTLSGTALPTVTVQLLRASDRVVLGQFTTGAPGTYILNPTVGSSVIVSPSRAGYSFVPSEVLYSTIGENKTQNFAAAAPSPTPTVTPTPTPTVTPTPSPSPSPTVTPTPTPSVTPTPLPACAPNEVVGNPARCVCTTRLIGNPKKCKPGHD